MTHMTDGAGGGRRARRRAAPRCERLEARALLAVDLPAIALSQGDWQRTAFQGSPIFADLDGDAEPELIVPASGQRIVAYSFGPDGTAAPFRTYRPRDVGPGAANFKSTPMVLTLPDGRRAIFAATARDEYDFATGVQAGNGYVTGWDAATGAILPGWPKATRPDSYFDARSGVYGPLASGDLDGDGVPEIVATSFSNFVTAFRLDGTMLWRWHANDSVHSGAVIGDIDRDGRNEVVLGADSSESNYFRAGGDVVVLDGTGVMKFRSHVGEVIWSSPVLADLNADGYLDIVVGTGHNFAEGANLSKLSPAVRDRVIATGKATGRAIYAIDHQGRALPGWPYYTTTDATDKWHSTYPSPAVADLDGDGALEVVAEDRRGYVHVIGANGQPLPGWAGGKPVYDPAKTDNRASPIVADWDGDGRQDVIAGGSLALKVFDARGNVVDQRLMSAGIHTAAAVGEYRDAVGQARPIVASVRYSLATSAPESVQLYRLPDSAAPAAWPMHRRSPDSRAIRYSDPFLNTFVTGAYRAATGRDPSAAELAAATGTLRSNAVSPPQLAGAVVGSAEARDYRIGQLYLRLLGRAPAAGELASDRAAVAGGGRLQDVALRLMKSAEYRALGTREAQSRGLASDEMGQVVNLYLTLMGPTGRRGRLPSPAELTGWSDALRSGGPGAYDALAAALLNTLERRQWELRPYLDAAGLRATADGDAAAALDLNTRARTEEQVLAGLLASGGNYAATNASAAWLRSAFRDLFGRQASAGEVASYLGRLDPGRTARPQTLADLANALVRSPEARGVLFRSLMGRAPGAAELAGLMRRYPTMESFAAALLASNEYFAGRGGRSNATWVTRVYMDVGGIGLSAASLQAAVRELDAGTPRLTTATKLMNATFTREKLVRDSVWRFIPDESLGVLRTGWTSPTGGQGVNPDPALVAANVDQLRSGRLDGDRFVVKLLTSPQYVRRAAYTKGLYRGLMIRTS